MVIFPPTCGRETSHFAWVSYWDLCRRLHQLLGQSHQIHHRRPGWQLPFLDTCILVNDDGSLKTRMYHKHTNTDQYLHRESNHHIEHKRPILYLHSATQSRNSGIWVIRQRRRIEICEEGTDYQWIQEVGFSDPENKREKLHSHHQEISRRYSGRYSLYMLVEHNVYMSNYSRTFYIISHQ